MQYSALALLGALGVLLSPLPAEAATPQSPRATYAPYLPDTFTWVVTSRVSKRRYQVTVALPDGYSEAHARILCSYSPMQTPISEPS